MPTVLLLRQLNAPLTAMFVSFIFPGRDDPLLHRERFKCRVECGVEMSYLEKVVIGLLR